MPDANRDIVRRRAGDACEYCRMPAAKSSMPFQVDHVVARQHGGPDAADNLAWACLHCNAHKGPNLAGIDPDTGRLTRLYNPRQDAWDDHFRWSGHVLVGKTDVGRATIAVLAINDDTYRSVRAAMWFEGVFPPRGD